MSTPPPFAAAPASQPPRPAWYRVLYIQVIIAVLLGIAFGHFFGDRFVEKTRESSTPIPTEVGSAATKSGAKDKKERTPLGELIKGLGDGFVRLVTMMIAPIIFCTVVHGIASLGDIRKLGRVGGKTLLYFEVVSTLALFVGLLVVNLLKPGTGLNWTPEMAPSVPLPPSAPAGGPMEFILNIIPHTFLGAFVSGNLLQVLLVAILVAFAISALGERGRPLLHAVDYAQQVFFGVLRIVVRAAPIGAFGAMAYTVGTFGLGSLKQLGWLMLGFYLTAAIFIIFGLGSIAFVSGFSIFRFLNHIKDELLLVLGTSSSETALPGMIQKMRQLGCRGSTVGLVIPSGYSFNLDGTNIYMAMAAIFLAQATNTALDLEQQLFLMLMAMITSKGASGVTGSGFVTLAATLAVVPGIPIESLGILVGIDRFMSECRAMTNLIGNGVATVVISRWEGEISADALKANLREPLALEALDTAAPHQPSSFTAAP